MLLNLLMPPLCIGHNANWVAFFSLLTYHLNIGEPIMQYSILKFFQHLGNPFLDKLVEVITLFGEPLPVIAIFLLVYWCINKKEGVAIGATLVSSLLLTNTIKPIFHIERPFVKHPDIQGKRVSTATGFSFPSGHTTTGATFYPTLAQCGKPKKGWLIASIIFALLIGLSRLYLGVHWPMDVLVGFIIGLLSSLILYPLFLKVCESKKFTLSALILGVITFVVALPLAIIMTLKPELKIYYSDLMKTAILASGMFLGLFLERKHVNFSTGGTLGKKALRFSLGLVGIALISLLKLAFTGNLYFIGSLLRYGLIGFWASYLYPLIAIKVGLMNRETV